jgi:DNA-binding IclR family transcriptional regulator
MGSNGTEQKTIKSTQTAFDIVETIAERGRGTITEIAEEVEHSRSTVHYHLQTLQQNHYVIKDDQGFRLGLRMARLGDLALQNHRLSGLVEPITEELATEVDAVAHVGVPEGDELVWLCRSSNGDTGELPTNVGTETPMHCTAYGQAILAQYADDVVADLVEANGLPELTKHTLTDREALDERLETIRKLGFAYSAEEYREGISSIAAPIIDEDDEAVGAIGVTASDDRIDDPYKHTKARRFSDELPGLVRQSARIASDKLTDS